MPPKKFGSVKNVAAVAIVGETCSKIKLNAATDIERLLSIVSAFIPSYLWPRLKRLQEAGREKLVLSF